MSNLNVTYTLHARKRMAERRTGEFTDKDLRIAKSHVLREIRHFCKGHKTVVTRESEYVYWHRSDGDDRIVFVTKFPKRGVLKVITAFRYKKIDSKNLSKLIKE